MGLSSQTVSLFFIYIQDHPVTVKIGVIQGLLKNAYAAASQGGQREVLMGDFKVLRANRKLSMMWADRFKRTGSDIYFVKM
ncbi:hypothetical protein DDZ16_13455 [Marinilabilia rubra]|uniref:Uncharacterized protein n=1 Tax=Marinilabilia rubra TaxID=2162893 RepID=A0A2U2B6N8_9BACT|nr:hypothetical protein DDZ16_13455 [Marinilabilia rubra]